MTPGIYTLGDFTITTAGTQTGDWVEDLEGLLALACDLRFQWGSGGTNVKAYLQTAFDDVPTPVDIGCMVFGTAAEHGIWNFSALTPKTQVSAMDATLADDTVNDGILGTKFRLKLITTGTYANTVLSGRINAR